MLSSASEWASLEGWILTSRASPCRESNKTSVAAAAVAFTFGSITVPSLASVYNEAALKRQMDTSVHLQNFFLYFYGALFNLFGTAVMLTVSRQPAVSMFHGLSKVGKAPWLTVEVSLKCWQSAFCGLNPSCQVVQIALPSCLTDLQHLTSPNCRMSKAATCVPFASCQ